MMLIIAALAIAADPCESVIQQDMNRCAVERAERADAALEAELRASERWARENAVDGRGVPGGATADGDSFQFVLQASQRTWIAYRDAQCRLAVYPAHGGSAAAMVEFGCRAALTETRVADLKALRS